MAITLGNITLDPACTTAREKYQEVGGQDARRITLSGLVTSENSREGIESALDRIMAAASDSACDTPLSLRPGRRLWVRRIAFLRETAAEALTGSFTLELEAADPAEEAIEIRSVPWSICASGATMSIDGAGNVFAKPVITLVAAGDLVCPSVSDGERTVSYPGSVPPGGTLVFDGGSGAATLNGEDVTAYTEGLFPRIAPEGAILSYSDGDTSSHAASAIISIRARWW